MLSLLSRIGPALLSLAAAISITLTAVGLNTFQLATVWIVVPLAGVVVSLVVGRRSEGDRGQR